MSQPTPDPLLLLRLAIRTSNLPKLSSGPTQTSPEPDPSSATHIIFTHPSVHSFPCNTQTRFHAKSGAPFDLITILFAWTHHESGIPAYVAACQAAGMKNLGFLERADLLAWLGGGEDNSEFLTPLTGDAAAAAGLGGAAAAGTGAGLGAGGAGGVAVGGASRSGFTKNPRLQEIYGRERSITNRNTVLRGIKPTDFSHVRKFSEPYLKSMRAAMVPKTGEAALPPRPGGKLPPNPSSIPRNPSSSGGKPRPQLPIILLSPSTSALLRMSNIKAFLEGGTFAPPSTSTADGESMQFIKRALPTVNPHHETRFLVVDSPDRFKPDYWARVVGVFTTGQMWQFKSYKWSTPQELFSHAKGFYVGWSDEAVPGTVGSWGNVTVLGVEKNRRFKDREVMEGFWDGLESWMVKRGWGPGGLRQ